MQRDVTQGIWETTARKNAMTISTVKIAVFHVETVRTTRSAVILMELALMGVIRGIKAPNVILSVMISVLVRTAAGNADTVTIIHRVIT